MKRYSILIFIVFQCIFIFAQSNKSENAAYRGLKEANELYNKGDYRLALDKFKNVFEFREVNFSYYIGAGYCAVELDQYEEANYFFLKSIEKGALDASFFQGKGAMKDFEESSYWNEIIEKLNIEIELVKEEFKSLLLFPISHFIPYQDNGKWGYLEKVSKQILVEAKYISTSFGGDKLMVEMTKNSHILIDAQRNLSHHISRKKPPSPPPFGQSPISALVDTSLQEYGFRIDENNVVTHVSNKYARSGNRLTKPGDIQYQDPFKINGKWHVLAKKDGNFGAVNEDGVFSEQLPNDFRILRPVSSMDNTEKWFYYWDSQNKFGFISSSGVQKYHDTFTSADFRLNSVFSDKWNVFVVKKENQVGIIDLTDMELIVSPITARLLTIKCTFNGLTVLPPKDKNSDIIDLYFLVQDNDTKEQFYIGKHDNIFRID